MNRENLQRMADFIRTIPPAMFSMREYRKANYEEDFSDTPETPECGTVGCIIGHCTALDAENVRENFMTDDGLSIYFTAWSEEFTGINMYSVEWRYLFSSKWVWVDNTPFGAANRIEYVLQHGFPSKEDMTDQMDEEMPLPYKIKK